MSAVLPENKLEEDLINYYLGPSLMDLTTGW